MDARTGDIAAPAADPPVQPAHRFADRVRVAPLPAAHVRHVGLHADDDMVIVFVEHGSGWYQHGSQRVDVTDGTALVTAPGEIHDAIGLRSSHGWLLEFTPSVVGMDAGAAGRVRPRPGHPAWLSFLRPACLSRTVALPEDSARMWATYGERVRTELHERPSGYNQVVTAHLVLLLLDIARLALPDLAGAALRSEPLLAMVFDLIEERFAQPISLVDVARAVSLSPAHLARLTRRLTGRTVNDWITERRMVEARRLLIETDEKIEQVARQAGFGDPSHFRRQFGRIHGAPPGAWRAARLIDLGSSR